MPAGFHVIISFEAAPGKAEELASVLSNLVSPSGMVETPRLQAKQDWCHVVACGITD
jgi:hypothetical protein